MKFISYNIATLIFALLAVYMMYNKIEGYGWCIFLAASFAIVPATKDTK